MLVRLSNIYVCVCVYIPPNLRHSNGGGVQKFSLNIYIYIRKNASRIYTGRRELMIHAHALARVGALCRPGEKHTPTNRITFPPPYHSLILSSILSVYL